MDEVKTLVRSVSFNNQDSKTTVMKSLSLLRMMMIEGSVGLKGREFETMFSTKAPLLEEERNVSIRQISTRTKEMDNQSENSNSSVGTIQQSPNFYPNSQHEAAVTLQKVYKSFQTRRKLADCAVLVEQKWWKLLDCAKLKRSSISFFDIDKHETAMSRWSRARTKAARVGKGLSKNDKASKLAIQHWLEAIDPRHRYGHNLHYYYVKWLHCESREPFFYWLDIGEGKEVNLEQCPRSKLQQQCINYLDPMERKAYEVVIVDGKFFYNQTGNLLHTKGENGDEKWIFVLSTCKSLYVGEKKKGRFQHSSFLAGGVTIAAGRLVVESGILKAVWPHSGHYQPTKENFKDFISFLEGKNVDLTDVKMNPVDKEEELPGNRRSTMHRRSNSWEEDLTQKTMETEDLTQEKSDSLEHETDTVDEEEELPGKRRSNMHRRSNSWEEDLTQKTMETEDFTQEKSDSLEHETDTALLQPKSRCSNNFSRQLSILEIPERNELFARLESDNLPVGPSCSISLVESLDQGYQTAEEKNFSEHENMTTKQNLFDKEHEENEVEDIPEESIVRRISSHKEMQLYQLGKQFSWKWAIGAGPRIGYVRDYPLELQFLASEPVNLSPRSACHSRTHTFSLMVVWAQPKGVYTYLFWWSSKVPSRSYSYF